MSYLFILLKQTLRADFKNIQGLSSPGAASDGFHYYIAFLDAYSKYTWFYRLNSKSQALIKFKKVFKNQTGFKICNVQSDNAK